MTRDVIVHNIVTLYHCNTASAAHHLALVPASGAEADAAAGDGQEVGH